MDSLTTLFKKEVLAHPLVVSSFGVVLLIALGSAGYYVLATRSPGAQWQRPSIGPITETVSATGSVEPAENPDLAFANGGRVASVAVTVGSTVSKGQLLASLNIATLAAQRAQAQANLKAAQAKLDELNTGPRSVDVAGKQTALEQAHTALANLYQTVAPSIAQAYDKAYSGSISSTDTLFSQPYSSSPALVFSTSNNQTTIDVVTDRIRATNELLVWRSESDALTSTSDSAQLDAALVQSLAHLALLRTYCDTLLSALSSAIPTTSSPQSTITSSQTAVASLRDTINTQILALQGLQQQVRSDTLAVTSAQDALNLTNAGATPQDIEAGAAAVEAAQANVDTIDAQIANSVIVAPYSGSVTSVAVKPGQIIAPDTTAISLTPHSALQVVVYVSEIDVAKLAVGNPASVTLDAYGSGRIFSADVVSLDRSPTAQGGIPAYKVTLQFSGNDPAVRSGMTANVAIVAGEKDSALIIPRSAVIQNGSDTFVLVASGGGSVERAIELGLIGTTTVEVTSGLSADDQILVNTK